MIGILDCDAVNTAIDTVYTVFYGALSNAVIGVNIGEVDSFYFYELIVVLADRD